MPQLSHQWNTIQRRPDQLSAPLSVDPTFSGKAGFLDLIKKLESLSLSAADQREYEGLLMSIREAYLGPHQKATMPGLPLEPGTQIPLALQASCSPSSCSAKTPAGNFPFRGEGASKSPRGHQMKSLNVVLAKNLSAQLETIQKPVQEKPLDKPVLPPPPAAPKPEAPTARPENKSVAFRGDETGSVLLSQCDDLLLDLGDSISMLASGNLSERAAASGTVTELGKKLNSLRWHLRD